MLPTGNQAWAPLPTRDIDRHDTDQDIRTTSIAPSFPADETSSHFQFPTFELQELRPTYRSHGTSDGQTPLLGRDSPPTKHDPNPAPKPIKFSGWRIGSSLGAITASAVLLINVIVTIYAVAKHGSHSEQSPLYVGSCKEVTRLSLWIHLAINALSTLLLSASNYTMQVLVSPTREEIDRAHARRDWLDIGIPSVRNLRHISAIRVQLWLLLAFSSVPLHLMYNTAVYGSLEANEYVVAVVSPDFLSGPAYKSGGVLDFGSSPGMVKYVQAAAVNNPNYTKQDASQCIKDYASSNFASKFRNVLLVTNDTSSSFYGARYSNPTDESPFAWACGDGYDQNPFQKNTVSDIPQIENPKGLCTYNTAISGIGSWRLNNQLIDHCIVETVPESCQLNYSLAIMLAVIVANFIKVCCMSLVIWKFTAPTMVTIGDAVASFLESPDLTTQSMCLATKSDIIKHFGEQPTPRPWDSKRQRWFKAASVKRWVITNSMCVLVLAIGAALLGIALSSAKSVGRPLTLQALWGLGFGSINPQSLVSWHLKSLISLTLIANLPQFTLSILYLAYNGIFTCLVSADEWNRFASQRKALRVTAPRPGQRSVYWLQLPYLYAVPLIILSGLLHWLLSQSLFLALITLYDYTGALDTIGPVSLGVGYNVQLSVNGVISTLGYSCSAIICAMIVGGVAVVTGIVNGFRRYRPGIPLAGSCSAAISAACHQGATDYGPDASAKPLMWGVIGEGESDGVGHCGFSSQSVSRPVEGRLYAGVPD